MPSQEKLMQEYADRKIFEMARIFSIAESASGAKQRKIFSEMMVYLAKNKIDILLCEKVDRITRNFKEALVINDWLEENPTSALFRSLPEIPVGFVFSSVIICCGLLRSRGSLNSSFAVFQDATGKAKERVMAMGIGVGSGYLFETTFEKEVFSDLTGERGVLMGALAGIMEAQYNELRRRGHSPSEAFNETVEEATQSLIPLISKNGMDWMYANCSTTAQRGALDWKGKFRKAVVPVFKDLYDKVKKGVESARVLKANSDPDYKKNLQKELNAMAESEMWRAGKKVRELRPENRKKK